MICRPLDSKMWIFFCMVVKRVLDTMDRCYSYSIRLPLQPASSVERPLHLDFHWFDYFFLQFQAKKQFSAHLEMEDHTLPLSFHGKDLAEVWSQDSRCGFPSVKQRCLMTFWTCWFYSSVSGENINMSHGGGLCSSLRALTSLNTASGGGNLPTHTATAVI